MSICPFPFAALWLSSPLPSFAQAVLQHAVSEAMSLAELTNEL
jgi:hypothetical protein